MKADITMPKVMSQVTIEATVTGVRRTRIRIWLGCKVMMLAAAIMGCNVEMDIRP
ncbi:hypothetical protein NUH86_16035 [Sphingobium sp. JS3065]|uniref:hypothetical protein n=1 Tax=Sphingobium sp. JS3065 TaxID=2970925 RepID=UPI0022641569|nr:hypothetical protein [Sphingobium sp. JS3065]UZW54964.1 hypothetical protein NUH86_16035 [Sphingobium sp. JS3065]